MHPDLEAVPDDHPKSSLFAEPIVVASLKATAEALDDGAFRGRFVATIKDAEGRRCPDLSVTARVTGPDRSADGEGHTDLMGKVVFRMAGSAGAYSIEILDVAAGGLDLDREASTLTASVNA